MTKTRKKLIEVALPLPEINDASAYDKMPGIGPHPKGIHQWWARLPLPTARAVLFASVVDDPSEHPDQWPTEEAQAIERERLFDIVRRMMEKKLHEHPEVYQEATAEMRAYTQGDLPEVFDPFAGGGSIPLEASRLGFPARAGDLNPVAVLLNKCNLELAPRWVGRQPVNPEDSRGTGGTAQWRGTRGLAADVRHYGRVIAARLRESVGNRYPRMTLPKQYGGGEAEVIAWIWARTVASPNPAARGAHVPLISSYMLSKKKGQEAWLSPVIDRGGNTYTFDVRTGSPDDPRATAAGTKLGRGAKFACLLTGEPIGEAHIKQEARAGRLGTRLVALVCQGNRRRVYLPASAEHVALSSLEPIDGELDEALADDPRNIWCVGYGLDKFSKLFTSRQAHSLLALSDSIREIMPAVESDALHSGLDEEAALDYAKTITTFLAFSLDRCADFNNSLCGWNPTNEKVMHLFGRQAIPMVWDFAEANIVAEFVGSWVTCSDYVADCVATLAVGQSTGTSQQIDAANGLDGRERDLLVSTDPPYYDNISYAGLSDFFYVWLRRTLVSVHPEIFSTILVPKLPELTASPERWEGDRQKAKEHFEKGFRDAFTALGQRLHPSYPLTVYYAFKQDDEDSAEGEDGEVKSVDLTTGWETLLEALLSSGFQITATWPVRASQKWRMV